MATIYYTDRGNEIGIDVDDEQAYHWKKHCTKLVNSKPTFKDYLHFLDSYKVDNYVSNEADIWAKQMAQTVYNEQQQTGKVKTSTIRDIANSFIKKIFG